MQRTPEELRRLAAEIRHAAQHAERLKDARAELARAAELEAEADRLEGKVRPAPAPIQPRIQESRGQTKQQRVNAAIEEIKRRYGAPK